MNFSVFQVLNQNLVCLEKSKDAHVTRQQRLGFHIWHYKEYDTLEQKYLFIQNMKSLLHGQIDIKSNDLNACSKKAKLFPSGQRQRFRKIEKGGSSVPFRSQGVNHMQCVGIESQKHDASIFEYRSLKFYEGSPAQYHPTESPAQKINNGGATQTNTRSDNIQKQAHLVFYRKHANIIANKRSLFTTVICSSYSNILILFSPINYVHYHRGQLLQYPQLYLYIYLFIGCYKAISRQLQLYKVCVQQMSFIFLLRCIFQVAEVLFMARKPSNMSKQIIAQCSQNITLPCFTPPSM